MVLALRHAHHDLRPARWLSAERAVQSGHQGRDERGGEMLLADRHTPLGPPATDLAHRLGEDPMEERFPSQIADRGTADG
jgi:hypothetical protein